jgi:hypothetical protein
MPEFGSWMIEATPSRPYGGTTADLNQVEFSMAARRFRINRTLPPGVFLFSMVNFPLLGAGAAFTTPSCPIGGPSSRSAYISDACISPHPRFSTLVSSIRRRRGRKVNIQIPLYRDKNTLLADSQSVDLSSPLKSITEITDSRFTQTEIVETVVSSQSSSSASSDEKEDVLVVDFSKNTESCARLVDALYEDRLIGGELAFTSPSSSSAEHANGVVKGSVSTAQSSSTTSDESTINVGPKHIDVPGHIHLDAMAFGMGCCCLQVTFQARDLRESRYLYDQLAVMSPIMLALTANAPIWKGHLSAQDTRWDVISASADCRTPLERGESEDKEPTPLWMNSSVAAGAAGEGKRRLLKSRYSSIDCYINDNEEILLDKYNDLPVPIDQGTFQMCRDAGIDERLSRHVANLFVRDPLVVFNDRIELDDTKSVEHFESLQSTNWRSMRWKPPPADKPTVGWRVELRTMEVQMTDFENAAFSVFIALLSRTMLFFDMNLYIPLSKLDENFTRASGRRAACRQSFWFRKSVLTVCDTAAIGGWSNCPRSSSPAMTSSSSTTTTTTGDVAELTIAEILLGHGKDGEFPGLIPLIHLYLDFIGCDSMTRDRIEIYLRLITGRATGEISTGATWQRSFVRSHSLYKQDSVVPPEIAADLLRRIHEITEGKRFAPDLLGSFAPSPIQITLDMLLRSSRASTEQDEKAVYMHLTPGEAAAAVALTTTTTSTSSTSSSSVPMNISSSQVPDSSGGPSRALRGASFREEMFNSYECAAIQRLITEYKNKFGLAPESIRNFESGFDSPRIVSSTSQDGSKSSDVQPFIL